MNNLELIFIESILKYIQDTILNIFRLLQVLKHELIKVFKLVFWKRETYCFKILVVIYFRGNSSQFMQLYFSVLISKRINIDA